MRYGDYDNVSKDLKSIAEIINRQGLMLVIDAIAEHVGTCAIKFKLSEDENQRVMSDILKEIKESILERV